MNGFDCDGVITVGLHPRENDVIITGRSYEELPETQAMLIKKGLERNPLFMNKVRFDDKTRESSGEHKARTLLALEIEGWRIDKFFEDDPIQADIIEQNCPNVNVVRIVHNLTEKENVRHYEE